MRTKFPKDITIAMMMPSITPTNTTPNSAPRDMTNSDLRDFHNQMVPGRSNREKEAVMTIAASVGEGISSTRPGMNSITAITPAAAIRPVI